MIIITEKEREVVDTDRHTEIRGYTSFMCLTPCIIRQLTGGKNQQMYWNSVSFLKIYLFIYRCHAIDTPLHRIMLNNKTFLIFYL
jgi:hypothetical protein